MLPWPSKIIIFGDIRDGNTMLLKLALARHFGNEAVITMPDDSQTLLGNIVVQPQDAIVFVLQDEQLAVYRENTFAKWQAVPALARIFSLSFNNPLMPVYVAAARDHFAPRTSRG